MPPADLVMQQVGHGPGNNSSPRSAPQVQRGSHSKRLAATEPKVSLFIFYLVNETRLSHRLKGDAGGAGTECDTRWTCNCKQSLTRWKTPSSAWTKTGASPS